MELFGYTEDGMTPMSWVNIALASCVTMCLQSYFSNYQEIEELAIQVDSSYEEGHFKLDIHLPKDLNSDNEQEILSFLDTYCRAKNFFREDIDVDISLVK
ncbi:MAG: OsmC family protein [Streptococcus thermophilus]|uniref:OsmC family protein n=2 Tax=Streptococcus thermophilus TaxID=1308 RepID=UPI0000511969|nr:OsmC family protein [Streptococcus thermophilus]AKB98113.1 Salt-stress induced protein [Streptococcus thermophilus]AXT15804.1 OsmC family peroxiredoxin [Streptococcus thermophilus]MBS4990739.1 OsmC family protein [Streptococcus thermophilus]MBW7805018.1 OsmC family protein [Streptococcus thermophilus]MBZ5798929.1 OsmC family protein [Streptococcus thermophilus]